MNRQFEISEDDRSRLEAIINLEDTTFSEIVKASGLSKSTDFRGANLSGIDLSNSDLRGFDFKDADLSGAYGSNFKIDESTILIGADTTGSVLALESERRAYFALHKDQYSLYKRLKNEYWATGAIWAAENLRSTSKSLETSAKIAKYLYAGVKDQTYKNSILYGIINTFQTAEEYKVFLLDALVDPTISHRSLRGVIDILSRSFFSDVTVQKTLLHYLGHENKEIRKVCVRPVMTGWFYNTNRDQIIAQMQSEPEADIRRLYGQCFCLRKDFSNFLLYREDTKAYHDYAQPIDNRVFRTLASATVRYKKIARKAAQLPQGRDHGMGTDVSYREIIEQMPFTAEQLDRLQQVGLPLKLTFDRVVHSDDELDEDLIDI